MPNTMTKKRNNVVMDIADFASPKLSDDLFNNKESELMQELIKLDNDYKNAVKAEALKEYDSKKSSYVMPDEAEIEKNAEKSVEEKYDILESKQQNKRNSSVSKIENDILATDNEFAIKEDKLSASYYLKEKELAEQIAKHNTMYSSIAELSNEFLENNKAKDKHMLKEAAIIEKEKLESQIVFLDREYELALDEYEISKAAELKKKASELKLEAEKQARIAEELNASIELEKTEYINNFENMLNELEQKDQDSGSYQGIKKDNYLKRYNLAKEYYTSLDKATAENLIKNNTRLKEMLGIYYEKLLSDIG